MKFASWSTRFQAFFKNCALYHNKCASFLHLLCHPYEKIGFYVYLGGGTAKITDFKQKNQENCIPKTCFFRKRSTFPRIENIKQGVLGGL